MHNEIKQLIPQLLPACKTPDLAEQEAWWLLEAVTQKSKSELLSRHLPLNQEQRAQLASCIAQRVQEHKPLQYILGSVPFCGLTIKVAPPILIPRPETEEWVTWLIELYQKAGITTFTALDLCTGTGCIGLALAKHFPSATVLGLDLNEDAITLANENKRINNLSNISFITSDLYQNVPTEFTCNLIVSNPPYLSADEYNDLDVDVQKWEDRNALVGNDNGMIFYRQIVDQAAQFIRPLSPSHKTLPNLILEIGPAQEDRIEQLMAELRIAKYTIHKDLQGKNRWISLAANT